MRGLQKSEITNVTHILTWIHILSLECSSKADFILGYCQFIPNINLYPICWVLQHATFLGNTVTWGTIDVRLRKKKSKNIKPSWPLAAESDENAAVPTQKLQQWHKWVIIAHRFPSISSFELTPTSTDKKWCQQSGVTKNRPEPAARTSPAETLLSVPASFVL